jgi:hypothetical protein
MFHLPQSSNKEPDMILAFMQILWATMLLLFLAGAVTYAFSPHTGLKLLKQALVVLAVLPVGPSLLSAAVAEISPMMLVVLGAVGSIAAYWYLTHHTAKDSGHRPGSGAAHAERQPHLPPEQDHQ